MYLTTIATLSSMTFIALRPGCASIISVAIVNLVIFLSNFIYCEVPFFVTGENSDFQVCVCRIFDLLPLCNWYHIPSHNSCDVYDQLTE